MLVYKTIQQNVAEVYLSHFHFVIHAVYLQLSRTFNNVRGTIQKWKWFLYHLKGGSWAAQKPPLATSFCQHIAHLVSSLLVQSIQFDVVVRLARKEPCEMSPTATLKTEQGGAAILHSPMKFCAPLLRFLFAPVSVCCHEVQVIRDCTFQSPLYTYCFCQRRRELQVS